MHAHFPITIGVKNPQTSGWLLGIDLGPYSGAGPGGVGNAQSAKASSRVLMLSDHVNLLTNHDGTDGEDKLLADASLLDVDVAYS